MPYRLVVVQGGGADLAPGTLLAAYRSGLFPMPVDPRRRRSKMAWFSPDPRAVLLPGELFDFNEVVDDVSIDRELWERIERRPDENSGDEPVEELAEEEEVEVDAQTSLETGEPMTPPDEFIPEKPE